MLGQKQKITIIIIGCGSTIPPFIVFVAIQVNYLWMRNGVCGPYFSVLTMDEWIMSCSVSVYTIDEQHITRYSAPISGSYV